MQIIKYPDPYANTRYGTTMDIVLPDDTPAEVIEEVQEFLDEDYRNIKSNERTFDRHTLELEGRVYEGADYAYRKTPEWIYLRKEQFEEILTALASLTETQQRRFGMFWEKGLSIREIARIEEADYKSVRESIETVRKKLAAMIENSCIEIPDQFSHRVVRKGAQSASDDYDEED